MSYKIVVIGCGNVGFEYIEKLSLEPNLKATIVLIDEKNDKLYGEVLDLEQSLCNKNSYISFKIGSYEDCRDADIICLTAGVKQELKDRLLDTLPINDMIYPIITKVMEYQFKGIFLVASNPLDVATQLVATYSDLPFDRVIGTGTMLDTYRLKTLLSKKLSINSQDISIYVLGEHGSSQFVVWNNANIGLQNINSFIGQEEKEKIENRVREMGNEIVSSKGFTSHGVASCLVKLTKAILYDEKCIFPVSNYQEDYDVYLSTPVVIGKNGIEKKIHIKLTSEEEKKLHHSAAIIKEAIEKVLPDELY